jgi:glycosyltransferase involved in cell wall biosynthesis
MTRVADVAVVMTAYNEAPYIERALRSVLNQSEPADAYEVIVVDDGSTDATARIVERFDEVTFLRNERQLGLPASLNVGIRAASARFVVRVDADDYVHHDFLHVLKLFLELNLHMEAIACDYMRVDEHEQHIDHCDATERPIGCGIMFRKERLIEIGLYDEDFLMAEDLDLRLRFERRWPIHRCELPLYRYRLHGENMTRAIEEHEEHKARALAKNGVETP